MRPRPPQEPPWRNPRQEAVKGRRACARDTPTSVGTSRPRSVSRPDRSRTTDAPSMMACARAGRSPHAPAKRPAAAAGRWLAPRGREGPPRAGRAARRARRVAAGALAAAGASTVAFAAVGRRGFGAAGARGGAAVSAVAVTGKATRSIDEMDMDPEHVTFASQDELDHRCASARTHPGFFRARATVAARVGARRRDVARAPTRGRFRSRRRSAGHTPRQTRHRGLRSQRVRRADLTRARESADHVARVRSRATRAGNLPARRSARALTRAPPRAPSRPASAEIPPPGPTRRAREAPSAHLFSRRRCRPDALRPPATTVHAPINPKP